MTLTRLKPQKNVKKMGLRLWYEKAIALLILLNYLLVIFDLTYIPLRDFWLQGKFQAVFVNLNQPIDFIFFKLEGLDIKFPPNRPLKILPDFLSERITKTYDPVKGIVPYRSTQDYLQTVEKLKQTVRGETNPAFQSSPEVDKLLLKLREDSVDMISSNPFQIANKTGTLERIKNRMVEHIYGKKLGETSAKQAFKTFWSEENLFKEGELSYQEEMTFFQKRIAPLMETNYFRPIGENSQPVDNFGAIDFPFGLFFFLEFLTRTWWISRRYTGLNWLDAMLWRWYDVFLFLPFYRWLRIIPLIIHLDQAQWINLRFIKRQLSQGFVGVIGGDITEVVMLRVINQVQRAIDKGAIREVLTPKNSQSYINLSNKNETEEILQIFLNIIIHKTLPEIRPQAEALLKYNLEQALTQVPAYEGIKRLPGVQSLGSQLTEQLSNRLYTSLYQALGQMSEDPRFNELLRELTGSFTRSFGSELKSQHTLEQMEILLKDLLEEVKVNYVQRLSDEELEDILEQTRQLHQSQDQVISVYPSKYNS